MRHRGCCCCHGNLTSAKIMVCCCAVRIIAVIQGMDYIPAGRNISWLNQHNIRAVIIALVYLVSLYSLWLSRSWAAFTISRSHMDLVFMCGLVFACVQTWPCSNGISCSSQSPWVGGRGYIALGDRGEMSERLWDDKQPHALQFLNACSHLLEEDLFSSFSGNQFGCWWHIHF